MKWATIALACLMPGILLWQSEKERHSYPTYEYEVARAHEIKPHRRTIPLKGVRQGFKQLRLNLTISATGDVLEAEASGEDETLKFWPQLKAEVLQWKFTPFEENGKAVIAEIEEYVDLVPPERLPKTHVAAPVLRQNSRIIISLTRTGCFGSCPSYTVSVSMDSISFHGHGYVVASGKHTDLVKRSEVQKLAKRFVTADFYSMDAKYRAGVTDNPTYLLSIEIDGHKKEVEDYVGSWVGMPAVISELEEAVDALARTERWIEGSDGLVRALQAEKYNFHTFEAQVVLKEAATRGKAATVRALLEAGTELEALPAPKPKEPYMEVPFANVGWLTAASRYPEVLQVLIDARASKNDQRDKDTALAGAARSGNIEAAQALLVYGANPNADLSQQMVRESSDVAIIEGKGAGSVLIYAAESGNPEMVRTILKYNPNVEARDREGKTALFAAVRSGYRDKDGARVECVRVLVQAGANVNARDSQGNTPLHETFLTDVEEELLKLGADVNARNDDGETPIFTAVDDEAIPLFIKHGADLTIRNNKGETVMEAAKKRGPVRQENLRKAIEQSKQH